MPIFSSTTITHAPSLFTFAIVFLFTNAYIPTLPDLIIPIMKTLKLTFSIIIPVFNYAKYLSRAVESTLVQSGDDFEVLVINDGSTDNTESVLSDLHICYPNRF